MTETSSPKRRSATHISSARARFELLVAHVERAALIDARLMNGCRSQGGLASVDAPELGIHSMSLNTLKVVSEEHIEGGFRELDRLRRIAIKSRLGPDHSASPGAPASSAQSGKDEADELRGQRQKLIDSCAFMADQYNDLLATYRRALDRLEHGRADPANERRLLDSHLKRFRGPKAQPLALVGRENVPGSVK